MYRTLRTLLPLILLISMVACAPAPVPPADFNPLIEVPFEAALRGMIDCAAGKSGTFMYSNGNIVLMGWDAGKGQYGFVSLSLNGNPVKDLATVLGGTGQKVAYKNMNGLIQAVIAAGWERVGPEALPVEFKLLLESAKGLAAFSAYGLTTFFVIPAGLLETGEPWTPEELPPL
jgi:hypothetical protein